MRYKVFYTKEWDSPPGSLHYIIEQAIDDEKRATVIEAYVHPTFVGLEFYPFLNKDWTIVPLSYPNDVIKEMIKEGKEI